MPFVPICFIPPYLTVSSPHAFTIRLEKLRKQSSNWRLSGVPTTEVKCPVLARSVSTFAKSSCDNSDILESKDSTADIGIDEVNIGSMRALLVGDSSGSEDEEKHETLIGTLRFLEEDKGAGDVEAAKTGTSGPRG